MGDRSSCRRLVAATFACLLALYTDRAKASGIEEFAENRFNPEHHVSAPALPAYAAGNLGVVMPSYWRVYLFLAWRALHGHPLTNAELALLNVQQWRVGSALVEADYAYAEEKNGVGTWRKARLLVAGAPDVKVDIEADVGDFSMIINCPLDAFERAAQTLQQRLAQGGQKWAAVWLANQDAVFENCSPPPAMGRPGTLFGRRRILPATLPAGAPAWLVRDHAYQSAAALFYAGFYDLARRDFLAIANDPASPWQPLGRYLAARCLLRKASVLPAASLRPGDPHSPDKVLLRTARDELAQAGRDYPPARRLLGWVDARVEPVARRQELSRTLSADRISAESPALLTDYLFLLDQMKPADMMRADDAMTAWIGAMQASEAGAQPGRDALRIARARWDRSHAAAWLLAMFTNARPGELKPDEIRAAAALREPDPAHGPLQYQLARLALESGDSDAADVIVSAMLRKPLAIDVRNRWLRMKMVSAPSAEAFFSAAARTPAEAMTGTPIPDEGNAALSANPGFDDDLPAHLRQHFSLATLQQLRAMIPAALQKRVGEFMWTRAVILGDYGLAQALTPELMPGRATTRPLYRRFLQAKSMEDKKNIAFLILANAPELVPAIDIPAGPARTGGMLWSCEEARRPPDGMGAMAPAFLAPQERAESDSEHRALRQLPVRSAYLIPTVMAWARKHRGDPEAPKALHLLVMSTRNECMAGANPAAPKQTDSKQAFQLLHGLFPASPWTAKTPYYY